LPDVSLVVPEDARPEVKAIIKENALNLRSKKASERVKAAQVLAELKEDGKPVRGILCRAMLDQNVDVRVAAADALKSIDPKMQYLAVGLVTDDNSVGYAGFLTKIQQLEEDGEPLSPLVAQRAILGATAKNPPYLGQELTVLSHIAKNDRAAFALISSALGHDSAQVRQSAIQALPRMKHGALAVPALLRLLQADTTDNRIAAIQVLVALADKKTEETIAEAISAQRYHKEEKVRRAVDEALNKLENKKK
jgi:HEAT repeat protein